MTKPEIVKQLEGWREYLCTEDCVCTKNDSTAPDKVINAAHGGKLYTAFDVIRIVQAAVSDAVCGMGTEDESAVIVYEAERGIIAKLVGEEQNHDD